ncbi:helix-turn-helix domain-containing protein [Virgibacillus oceani]
MEHSFAHLSAMENGNIEDYMDEGLSLRKIERRMGHNPSTISREMNGGTVQQIDTNRKTYTTYFPDAGARVYRGNRDNCRGRSTMMDVLEFIEFAEEKS